MKKLILLLGFVLVSLVAMPQATTIVDGENHIETQYPNGDTVFTGTGIYAGITLFMDSGNEITVLTGQTNSRRGRATSPSFFPSEFGYTTGRQLAGVLVPRYFHEWYETYDYTSGNIDTITYSFITPTDTTAAYDIVYKYGEGAIGADTLTSRTIIPQ